MGGTWGNTAKGKASGDPFAGSVYAQKGTWGNTASGRIGGGSGDPYAQAPATAARPKLKNAGLLGGLKSLGHLIGSKSALAGHDIAAIPGGLYDQTKTAIQATSDDLHGRNKAVNEREWHDIFHGHIIRALHEADKGDATKAKAHAEALVRGLGLSAKTAVTKPWQDPFATVTTVLPALHGLGKIADAATAGRLASSPRMIRVGDTDVPLHPSEHPAIRAAQGIYDRALQHALDNNPEGRVARHAMKRVGGSIAETERYRQRMRAVPAGLLDHAARQLLRGKLPATRRLRQAALELTSVNTTPEEAAAYHEAQAAAGVNPARNARVAALYRRVANEGMLTTDEHDNVVVNHETHPALAAADVELAHVQHLGDEILADHGIRSRDVLEARRDAPARIRAGGHFIAGAIPEVAKASQQLEHEGQLSLHPRTDAEQVGTGIVGGESARPGRGFVSYKTQEARAPRSAVARSQGPVVGEPRSPITSQAFKGAGIEQGLVPKDITGAASHHLRALLRFANTSDLRNHIADTGSAVRRTSRDVLVRIPGAHAAKISQHIDELLGRKSSTIDDEHSLAAALDEYRHEMVPGLADKFAGEKAVGIGMPAPEGYRWVDQSVLGPLIEETVPRGAPARLADWINSLVTSATVYLKPGHIGTRLATNAAANMLQGSATPAQVGRSAALWDALAPQDRLRALAAAGQHGFQAMPHEGQGAIARIATRGSDWWARHADQAFRFNSIAYEARRAGFDTPQMFAHMLDVLETRGAGVDRRTWERADRVAKRSNRAQLAYDRLNPAERRYVGRFVWFYPFLKASAMFAGHTFTEHPYKGAVLGNAGEQGRERQQQLLGDLPSYEGGLIPVGGSAQRPLVTDFSTFSPIAAGAELLNQPEHGAVAELVNPAIGALLQLALRQNQYGQHTNTPIGDAAATLFSPTPEAQVIGAAIHPTHGMFDRTWQTALARALAGPATPRRINLAKAHKAAGRERSGR